MSIRRTGQFLITGDTEAFTAAAAPGGGGAVVPRKVSIMDVINFCDPTLDHHDISFVRIVLVGAGGGGSSAGSVATIAECAIWGCGGGGGGMIDISGAPKDASGGPPGGAAGLLLPGKLSIGSGGLFQMPGQIRASKNGLQGGDTVWDFTAHGAGIFSVAGGLGGPSGLGGPGGAGGSFSGTSGALGLDFLIGSGNNGGQGGNGGGVSPGAGTGGAGTGAGGVSGASLSNHSYPIFYNKQGRASAPPNIAIQNAARIHSTNLMEPKYASAAGGASVAAIAAKAAGTAPTAAGVAGVGVAGVVSVRKYATTWIVPSVMPSANTQRDWYVQQVGRGGAGSTTFRNSGAGTLSDPGPTDPICGGGGAIAVFWTSYH
jgi:hypothetical protein